MRLLRFEIAAGILCAALALSSCASSPEAKSARFMENGKKMMKKNDAARAILQFQNAVRATPKNAEAQYQLGLAYLAADDLKRGVASLRAAISLNPKHTAAQLRLAELMTESSNEALVKDAQERLQTLLQNDPEDSAVLHALALTELKLGDPKDAMQHLTEALAKTPKELVIAVTLAEARLQEKDSKGAAEVMEKACAASPESAECVVILGRVYASFNRLTEAAQKFRQALAMDPKNAPALLNLSMLQAATGQPQEAESNLKKLSGLPDMRFRFYHANYLFQLGRRDESIKELEGIAQKNPDDRAARTHLVAAYQGTQRTAEAQKILDNALKKNGNDLDALLQRGEIFLGAGKYEQAETDVNRLLHMKPDSPQAHYVMAGIQAARGAALRQRQELYEVLRLNPFLLKARVELAKDLIASGSSHSAYDLLNVAPESQRQLVPVVEQRNWALLSMQQFQEARKEVDRGLLESRTPDLLLQDAILKIQNKRYDDARQSVKEALQKSPEDLRALRLLVGSYSAQSQNNAAVAAVREYAAQHANSAAVQYFFGRLLFEAGEKAQAKQVLSGVRAANPGYTPATLALAQVDLEQGNWNDARQPLNTILATKEDPLARKWLGMLEVSVGNQAAAIADFRKAIEVQPNDAASLNNLAYLLVESGGAFSDEALKDAQKAVELAPDNPDFQDTLGWVLYRKGLYDSAITHIQSAVSKRNGARYQYHLAMAYFKAGDASKGDMTLRAALRSDPNLPEAKQAQELSQEIRK